MSDIIKTPPPNRMEKLGRDSAVKKPAVLTVLTPRHRLLIEYMVYGVQHPSILQAIKRDKLVIDETTGQPVMRKVSPAPGEQLELIEAADLLGIRRRNARGLSNEKLFQNEFAKEIEALRTGAKARAMQTVIDVMDDPGAGKAADKKVRLEAAGQILGLDAGGKGSSVNVNVFNGGQTFKAGIVVRLPPTAPATPLDRGANAKIIEHKEGENE